MSKVIKVIALITTLVIVTTFSVQAIENILTITQARQESQSSDIDAILAQKDITELVEAKDQALEDAEDTNVLAGTAETQLNSKVKKYISPLQSQMNIELATRNENQRITQRLVDTEYAYWQLHLATIAIDKANLELKIANNNYESAKIKLQNGNISANQFTSQKHNVAAKQLKVFEANNNYKKAQYNLNEFLGKELNNNLNIADNLELKVPKLWSFNTDSLYEKALIVNENIYKLQKETEFAKMKLQYAGEEFKTSKDEYLDVATEKEKADNALVKAKKNLYKSITVDGNSVLSLLENNKLLELQLKIEQSNFKAVQLKYNKGAVSKNEYLQANLSLKNIQYQLQSNIANLNKSYESFNIKYIYESK
ncbi:hypothetical protein IMX26_07385 [Clostridium sp. 'deep sea']|uniref:hypothetical protein n=1 Tax=Clostridium sp. 'deep sea' TaxID=2779445 RepID=UPI001896940E|nr:hypothetical protein [Clostridium sp. 'deep sea']QOR36620.1 hypothetical protein IMX26_07385 [Clostridium sp. 'deep sea']